MNLIPVNFKEMRVLTTEQLAHVYETGSRRISENFNRNMDKFVEGKHYFKLEGDILRAFKNDYANCVSVKINSLYLWTRQGASRHCKMLGTDKAWEQFDILEESYFNQSQNLLTNNLSPQLQLLINMELKQKEIEARQDKQEEQLQGIREVVTINNSDGWKDKVKNILNKIVRKTGLSYVDIRHESYELLESRCKCRLSVLQTNKRKRLRLAGATRTAQNNVSKIEVIGENPRLTEGYLAVIKDLAIRYVVTL